MTRIPTMRTYIMCDAEEHVLRAVATCRDCGREFHSPPFDESKLDELETRHVQDVFPDWSPADRELYFITGICGDCWKKLFPPEEEDGHDE